MQFSAGLITSHVLDLTERFSNVVTAEPSRLAWKHTGDPFCYVSEGRERGREGFNSSDERIDLGKIGEMLVATELSARGTKLGCVCE